MDPSTLLGSKRISNQQFDRLIRKKLGLPMENSKTTFLPINYNATSSNSEQQINQALSQVVQPHIRSKQDLANFFRLLENHYLTRIIRISLTHDFFYRSVDYSRLPLDVPIMISGSKTTVNKAIKYLKDMDYSKIIREILDQVYYLGEYLTFVDAKNRQLDDLFDQERWRAVYLRGKLQKIIVQSDDPLPEDAIQRAVILRIRHLPFRTNIRDVSEINYTVYTGMPIIGSEILNLINTIRMLESLMPVSQILSVQSSQLIYLRVPPGNTSVEEAFKLARQYEYFLNAPLNSLTSQDPNEIIFNAARYKVTPLFGDKGNIEPRSLDRPNPVDIQSLTYFKQALSDAIPMPGVYLGIQDQIQDRTKSIQYAQLIESIRKAVSDFTHDILILTFPEIIKDPEFSVDPVRVIGMQEAQLADHLDLSASVLTTMSQVLGNYSELTNSMGNYLDIDLLREVFNTAFYPLTANRDLLLAEPSPAPKSSNMNFNTMRGMQSSDLTTDEPESALDDTELNTEQESEDEVTNLGLGNMTFNI